jgi:hypothetical protein
VADPNSPVPHVEPPWTARQLGASTHRLLLEQTVLSQSASFWQIFVSTHFGAAGTFQPA